MAGVAPACRRPAGEEIRRAWIFHQLKRPNGVGRLNPLAFNNLPNGRVLTKFQHCVPHGRVTGRDGDHRGGGAVRPLRQKPPVYP